jgi:putative membrane protein
VVGHGSGSAYAVMSLGMIAFWALVLWAVIAIRRGSSRHGVDEAGETATAGAQRILAERFARGEIDTDEYHRRLADLDQQHLAGSRP